MIDEFIAKANRFTRPNRFKYVIAGPTVFDGFAHTVQMPTTTITYASADNYINGITIDTPNGLTFGELVMTFYVTERGGKLYELEYFQNWSIDRKGDGHSVISNADCKNYMLGYIDDYGRDIEIHYVNEEDAVVYGYKFLNAYPTAVSPSQLSFGDTNTIYEVTVNFSYDEMKPI